ncbi:helix-turn-helix transcriptional regulator [Actinomycetota bacterium]
MPRASQQHRDEVRDFLTSRRARLTPEQAGLPLYGTNRRVSGLRREEVALLSGISTDYSVRMERGTLDGVSDQVLDAVAAALRLSDVETAHLHSLARASRARPPGAAHHALPRPGVQRVLDAISAPAYARNGRFDVLALNSAGRALFSGALGPGGLFNLARYVLLDPGAPTFYRSWDAVAQDTVAWLRGEVGRRPDDPELTRLIDELTRESTEFEALWAAHELQFDRAAVNPLHHPVVGDLELTGEALTLPGEDDLWIVVYLAEPASPSQDALDHLVGEE